MHSMNFSALDLESQIIIYPAQADDAECWRLGARGTVVFLGYCGCKFSALIWSNKFLKLKSLKKLAEHKQVNFYPNAQRAWKIILRFIIFPYPLKTGH